MYEVYLTSPYNGEILWHKDGASREELLRLATKEQEKIYAETGIRPSLHWKLAVGI